MIEGLWTATFGSNIDAFAEGQNSEGSGVVIFDRNYILGGDVFYYYVGRYEMDGDTKFTGVLHVERYIDTEGIANGASIFGDLPKLDLEVKGQIENGEILAMGELVQDRRHKMFAKCVKRADIDPSMYPVLEKFMNRPRV